MARSATCTLIAAFNALGVEAATLGNHEFNYGTGFLEASLAGAAFPVVSADVPGVAIEPAGNGPDGFARFRITL